METTTHEEGEGEIRTGHGYVRGGREAQPAKMDARRMTAVRCTKCDREHEVDFTDKFASMLCEECRPKWGTAQREWLRIKGKRKPNYKKEQR